MMMLGISAARLYLCYSGGLDWYSVLWMTTIDGWELCKAPSTVTVGICAQTGNAKYKMEASRGQQANVSKSRWTQKEHQGRTKYGVFRTTPLTSNLFECDLVSLLTPLQRQTAQREAQGTVRPCTSRHVTSTR